MNDENKHSTDTPALRHSAPAELPSSEQPLIDFPENKKANPDAGASSKGQENSDNNQKYPSLFANISSSIRNFFSPTTPEPNGENSSVNTSLDTLEAKGDNSSKNDQSTPRESLSNLSEKSNISQVSSLSSESESKISRDSSRSLNGSASAVSELSTSSSDTPEAKQLQPQPQQFNATIGSPLEPQNENNPKNTDPNNKPDSVSSTFNMWKPQHQTFSSAISQDNKDSNIQQAALWYHTSAASCYAQDPNNSLYLEEVEQFNEYADKVFTDDFKLNPDQIDEIKKLQQPPLDTVGNDGLSLRQMVSDQLEEFSRSKKSDNGSWPFFINTSSTSGLSSGTVSPEGNQFTVNKNASTLSLTGSSAKSIGSNLVEASIDMGMYSNPNEKVRYTLYGDVGKKLDSILDRLDENETNIDQACFTLNGYKCNDLEALQNALNNPEHPLYQSLRGDWTWHSASYKRQKLRTKIQHLIEKRDNQKVQQKSSTPQPVDARHFTRSAIVKRAAMHEHPTRACHDSMVNNIKGMKDDEKTKLLEDADEPSKNRIFTAVCESCGLTKEEAETVSSANKLTGCSSIAKNLEKKLEKVKALLPKQSQNPSPYQTILNNFDNRTKLDKLVNSAGTLNLKERTELLKSDAFSEVERQFAEQDEVLKKNENHIKNLEEKLAVDVPDNILLKVFDRDSRKLKERIDKMKDENSKAQDVLQEARNQAQDAKSQALILDISAIQKEIGLSKPSDENQNNDVKAYINTVETKNQEMLSKINTELQGLENKNPSNNKDDKDQQDQSLKEEGDLLIATKKDALEAKKEVLQGNIERITLLKIACSEDPNSIAKYVALDKLKQISTDKPTQSIQDRVKEVSDFVIGRFKKTFKGKKLSVEDQSELISELQEASDFFKGPFSSTSMGLITSDSSVAEDFAEKVTNKIEERCKNIKQYQDSIDAYLDLKKNIHVDIQPSKDNKGIEVTFYDIKVDDDPISIELTEDDFTHQDKGKNANEIIKEKIEKQIEVKRNKNDSDRNNIPNLSIKGLQNKLLQHNLSENIRILATDPQVYTGKMLSQAYDFEILDQKQTNKFVSRIEEKRQAKVDALTNKDNAIQKLQEQQKALKDKIDNMSKLTPTPLANNSENNLANNV